MDQSSDKRTKQVVTAVAVLIAIALIVTATVLTAKENAPQTTDNSQSSATSQASRSYKDGTYTASADYQSPGGSESIKVTITLDDGVVTDSTVVGDPSDSEAKEYQDMFISGYKNQVVGKSIDSVSLSRVSGSSLTSIGFNSALDAIKQQAEA